MTGAVAGAATKTATKAGGGFKGAKSVGIEKPPPGHFDKPSTGDGANEAPSTQDSAAPAPARKTAPKQEPPAKEPEKKSGLSIGPPVPPAPQMPAVVNQGAGFILGLLFWTWVAVPFLNNGGVKGVKDQLRAKFLNKAPDGSWLP